MKRIIYLFYYLKDMDYDRFISFRDYVLHLQGVSKKYLYSDILYSTIKYKVSIMDYFYFRFFEKSELERSKWAGTGFMYEYQLQMNPRGNRNILEDKGLFLRNYKIFIQRSFLDIAMTNDRINAISELLVKNLKLVIKSRFGQVGRDVQVISSNEFDPIKLLEYMNNKNYEIIEEYVHQHDALHSLSPSGLNTVRIITQLKDDKVDILGARLRVSVNSVVDNLGAGNIAASINLQTGIVDSAAIYSDITKSPVFSHPITKVDILNFQVPFWDEVLKYIIQVAQFDKSNKSVGWDIAITNSGPELIEGNHNWCKLLWQLPVQKGLKSLLEKYT